LLLAVLKDEKLAQLKLNEAGTAITGERDFLQHRLVVCGMLLFLQQAKFMYAQTMEITRTRSFV
jgi:hypothetical protein